MRLGPHEIHHGVLLAPMEDVTDLPFRVLCKRLGADIVYTEFVKSEDLLRGASRARRKLLFREEERPIGIQLYGTDPDAMADAARLAASHRPDFVDLNAGCWVRDVALRGAGAGLLRDLPQFERMVSAVVRSMDLPVTVKTRLGWDARSIHILDVARMCEANGVAALAVHCRTRDQGHAGRADYEWIPRLKAAVSIPIVVNGDVGTAADVQRLFDTTGCDAVMIGRAALRNPWIFRQAKHALQTGERLPDPTPEERLAVFRQHLELAVDFLGEPAAVRELRKHYAVILHGNPHVEPIRDELRRATSPAAVLDHLACFLELYASTGAA